MNIKSIYFSFALLITFAYPLLNAMNSANSLKRPFDTALNTSSDQLYLLVDALERDYLNDNNQDFIQQIKNAIYNLSPADLGNLLKNGNSKNLTNEQRKELYQEAQKYETYIQEIAKKNEAIIALATNITIKNKFDLSNQVHDAEKNSNYLHAFQFIKKFTFPQAFFTPQPYNKNDPRPSLDKILEILCANEQKSIQACCFHITLYNLAEAFVKQKNKNVSIELLTNQKQSESNPILNGIKLLLDNNVTILAPKNNPYEANHHKFFLFGKNILDKALLWHGSYNATGHSNQNSWEDITINDNPDLIESFSNRYNEVRAASTPITIQEIDSIKTNPSSYSLKSNNVPTT